MTDNATNDSNTIPEQFDGRRRWEHVYLQCFNTQELINDIQSFESDGFEIVTINVEYTKGIWVAGGEGEPVKYWEVWMKRPYRYKQTPEGFVKTYE